ncbi:SET domain-containing protein [Aspergillus steynii IBT 23096]|uniref:SET domain-containing protein n=1 Tax=Aspergillus steynii IBT 23096 TaxID=1392250 RepID=A0A2I2GHN8_9EURO|nr:SET domain-containing protein [Aspergillus steynii IBT 23096]PLB52374.1 SET domain-containing protein [Aspergillus steynii IBT 23096]
MKPEWWPGEDHELFTEWAIAQGIVVNGVNPARFPGRGLGMIATRAIEEGEAIVTVPLRTMFTPNSIPSSFSSKFPDGTPVHALYAAFFTNGDPENLKHYEPWRKTWPSLKDFEDGMPILWPSYLRGSKTSVDSSSEQTFLPPSISGSWSSIQKGKSEFHYETTHQNLLSQQESRLRDAWDAVVAVFPKTDWETFSYHWLIVNTRSFFFLMPGEEAPEDRNDAMALLPFADYFNHSDVACNVKFNGLNYIFRATKHYDEGEEIYMSYGPHPNDFLLTEYGFFLDHNESETLYLDDIIFRDLSKTLQEELEFEQYYGNYQLTAEGVCYRTEIAACIKYMAVEDWRNYTLGYSTKNFDAAKSEAIIREWIKTYANEADTVIASLEKAGSQEADLKGSDKVKALLKRWTQIKTLCDQALQTVSC